jgi:hypothetical protein
MRLTLIGLLSTLAACTQASAPRDEAADAAPAAVPAGPDVRLRFMGFVERDDRHADRLARIEVRNTMAWPIRFEGTPDDGATLRMDVPDIGYYGYRDGRWKFGFPAAGPFEARPGHLDVAPRGTAEIRFPLHEAMLDSDLAGVAWRACARVHSHGLRFSRCTAAFDARSGIGIETPPAKELAGIFIHDEWRGLPGGERVTVFVSPNRPVAIEFHDGRMTTVGGPESGAPVEFEAEDAVRRQEGDKETERPGKRVLTRAQVDALLAATQAPPVSRDAFLERLAAPHWLSGHAAAAYAQLPQRSPPCRPEAERVFMERFADPGFVRAAVIAWQDGEHTDDYPQVRLAFQLPYGTSDAIASSQQEDWMLPWTTVRGESWDPAISAAIGAALPEGAPDRGRLLGRPLERIVADAVIGHIDHDEWNRACEGH